MKYVAMELDDFRPFSGYGLTAAIGSLIFQEQRLLLSIKL